MTATTEQRLAALEGHTRAIYDRLSRVEWELYRLTTAEAAAPPARPPARPPTPARPAPQPPQAEPRPQPEMRPPMRPPAQPQPQQRPPMQPPARQPQPQAARPSAPPRPPRRQVDLEELLGGRLLALVGGLAVLLGLAFLVALAIDRGWLGEWARIALAFFGSAGLLVLGAWLHERRGATQASLAVTGTGIAGLFLSLTAATALYELVPIAVALAIAFLVGAAAAALAIRWDATPIGGLGILGALGAPILVGATQDVEALLFLAIAHAAAVAVLVWRRWVWLRLAAVALVLAQLAGWVVDGDPSVALAFPVLALFTVLNLAAGLGHEVRRPTGERSDSTFAVVAVNAVVAGILGAAVGSSSFDADASWVAAGWWLAGLAVLHVGAGLLLLRVRPDARPVALTVLGIGLVGANLSFVVLVSGTAIPIGWAAAAAALAVPVRLLSRRAEIVYAVVGAQLLLAVGHVLVYDAPPDAVAEGGDVSVWPILAIAAGAFAVARLTPRAELQWRAAADATALVAVAYGTAVVLDGVALGAAWAAEAVVLAALGRRLDHRVSAVGAFGFLALAAVHALSYDARPVFLVDGPDSLWRAALAVGAVAAAGFAVARVAAPEYRLWREVVDAGVVGAVLYGSAVLLADLPLVGAWAGEAVALAAIGRWLSHRVAAVGAFAALGLAALHVVAFEAPFAAVADAPDSLWQAAVALGAVAAAALLVARLTRAAYDPAAEVVDAVAILTVVYGTAVLLADAFVPAAWAGEAIVLAELGRRFGHRVAAVGALPALGLAAVHALVYEASPVALVDGADPFWHAALALGAVVVAAAFAAWRSLPVDERIRPGAELAAGIGAVYLASVGIVSAFQPGAFDALAGELSVREQGQAVLSGFWSLLGLGLLWAGLRRDERTWRLAGFALLAVAVGKVFLYDMAALDAGYRVLSFIVLGLLLLAGAYAYQRMRRGTGAAT